MQRNFWLINYSLGHVNCFVSIHVLLQLSVFYHHHEENEASYAVWLSCSKYVDYSLSEWLICISSNTWFTRMVCSSKSESAQTKNVMETPNPRGGWLATQSTPPSPGSAPGTACYAPIWILMREELTYTIVEQVPTPGAQTCVPSPLLSPLQNPISPWPAMHSV